MRLLPAPPSKHYYATSNLMILQNKNQQILVQQWRSNKAKEEPVMVPVPIKEIGVEETKPEQPHHD